MTKPKPLAEKKRPTPRQREAAILKKKVKVVSEAYGAFSSEVEKSDLNEKADWYIDEQLFGYTIAIGVNIDNFGEWSAENCAITGEKDVYPSIKTVEYLDELIAKFNDKYKDVICAWGAGDFDVVDGVRDYRIWVSVTALQHKKHYAYRT